MAFFILASSNILLKIKDNRDADWLAHQAKFQSYGFEFTQEHFKSFEEVMKGRLDLVHMFNTFKKETFLMLFQIRIAFCCHMYDLDRTSFVTSNRFSSQVINFLSSIPGRERCSLKIFFKIKSHFLKPHILKLGNGEWFDPTYKQFVFFGALPIFYLVLLKLKIIDLTVIEEVFPAIFTLKSEYKNIYSDRSWIFNFLDKLEMQASIIVQTNSLVK